jgi:hypothetical protein
MLILHRRVVYSDTVTRVAREQGNAIMVEDACRLAECVH